MSRPPRLQEEAENYYCLLGIPLDARPEQSKCCARYGTWPSRQGGEPSRLEVQLVAALTVAVLGDAYSAE